jgi:hypothetical protein
VLVPGSGPQSNAKAYVIIKGFTDRISADPSALEIMQQIDRMFGDVIPASLKLFLGAQPTKSPELNANNKVPPALVLNLKLEPVRPPSSQPGGTGSYAGAAPGDSLARAAVLFKVAKPITGTWALQDPGTYAIRSIEQVRPG